ncbi:MAG: hypothetical protein SFU83_08505 [Meiothermus sp.]|nr:hypothetical protein [Meiothermus sp.]
MGSVKPNVLADSRASHHLLSWSEVLATHKTLRGIGRHSLLVDRGESGYRNRFLEDGRILYPGEGLAGDQQPLKGNRVLLEALADGRGLRVYRREAVNQWSDLGLYKVAEVEYRFESAERRHVYWFTLTPTPRPAPTP